MTNIFKDNKWTRTYFNIIDRAKLRGLDKSNIQQYTEKHHVIPKSLGGSNDCSNLVLVTAKEHFVCHHLLIKMVDGVNYQKMIHAYLCMISKSKYTPTARHYEKARNLSSSLSRSNEWKEKISKSIKGKKRPKELVERIRQKLIGRRLSDIHRSRIRNAVISREGRGFSAKCRESRLKMLEKTFEVQYPDGRTIEIKNLKMFCAANNFNYASAANNSKTLFSITRGSLKGFNFRRL